MRVFIDNLYNLVKNTSLEKTFGAFVLTILIFVVFSFLPWWLGFVIVFVFLNVSNHIAVTIKARRNHIKV
jgi:hypothetical protein